MVQKWQVIGGKIKVFWEATESRYCLSIKMMKTKRLNIIAGCARVVENQEHKKAAENTLLRVVSCKESDIQGGKKS